MNAFINPLSFSIDTNMKRLEILILLLSVLSIDSSWSRDSDRWTKTMLKIANWQMNQTSSVKRTSLLVEEKYWHMMSVFDSFYERKFSAKSSLIDQRLLNFTVATEVSNLRGAQETFKKFLSSSSESRFEGPLPADFYLIGTQINLRPYVHRNNYTFNDVIRKYCSSHNYDVASCFTLLYLRAASSVIKFYSLLKIQTWIKDTPTSVNNYISNALRELKRRDREIFGEIFSGIFDERYGCHLSCPYVGVKTPQRLPTDEFIQSVVNGTSKVLNLESIRFTSNFIISHAFLSTYDLIPSCHAKCEETTFPKAVILFDTTDGEVKFDNETRFKCVDRDQALLKYAHGFKIDTTFVTGGFVDDQIVLCHTGGWKIGECVVASVEKDWTVRFNPIATKLSIDTEYVDGKAVISLENGSKLWRTGGTIDTSSVRFVKKTNIFFNMTWRPGPELPIPLGDHCMIQLNSSHTLITGGFTLQNNLPIPSQRTWTYDWNHDRWTELNSMPEPIRFPKCSIKNSRGDVLLVGKYRGDTFRQSDLRWTDIGIGELPATSQLFGTMVYLKGGPYLYGGQHQISQEKTNKIYKYVDQSWNMDNTQFLSKPRQHLFPVTVPLSALPQCN